MFENIIHKMQQHEQQEQQQQTILTRQKRQQLFDFRVAFAEFNQNAKNITIIFINYL